MDCLVLNFKLAGNKQIVITLNHTLKNASIGTFSEVYSIKIQIDVSSKIFKISLNVLIINDDTEIINERIFFEFDLSQNKIKTIHKDFVDLEDLLLDNNLLESLDNNTFAYNSNLKFVNLNSNKLKTLPTMLFSRNTKLEYLFLINNLINQIEEGFYLNLVEMKHLYLQKN